MRAHLVVMVLAVVVRGSVAIDVVGAQETSTTGSSVSGRPGSGPFAGASMGTGLQPLVLIPEGSGMSGAGWTTMGRLEATVGGRVEGGPRGDRGVLHTGTFMGHARRRVGPGWLELQAMISTEPLLGPDGYPLLLQHGETADGVTPLVDRQHPHDLVMAVGASYRVEIEPGAWAFLYVAPVGSPAVGPTAFMHRVSSAGNPVAPLSHHFLDATHIAHGVVTGGLRGEWAQVEASWFNGREPDERRWSPEAPSLDSYSARFTLIGGAGWTVQGSFAELAEPEQLHPAIDVRRLTLSATHARALGDGMWTTTAAWGRNTRLETTMTLADARARIPPALLTHYLGLAALPDDADESILLRFDRRSHAAVLVESAVRWPGGSVFARAERALKDELFPPSDSRHSSFMQIATLTVGGVVQGGAVGLRWLGAGAGITLHRLPASLEEEYGRAPASLTWFARLSL